MVLFRKDKHLYQNGKKYQTNQNHNSIKYVLRITNLRKLTRKGTKRFYEKSNETSISTIYSQQDIAVAFGFKVRNSTQRTLIKFIASKTTLGTFGTSLQLMSRNAWCDVRNMYDNDIILVLYLKLDRYKNVFMIQNFNII